MNRSRYNYIPFDKIDLRGSPSPYWIVFLARANLILMIPLQ